MTNIYKNVDKIIPNLQATGVAGAHKLILASPGLTYVPDVNSSQLLGTWAPEGQVGGLEDVLDTDAQTTLLGSFTGANPNGDWPLFLSDLDFGEPATLMKWGNIVTAIPEPSPWAFVGMGGAFLAALFMRRRVSN